jgi:cyclopropane fatty-acyl-phospholipid synthase-like methyltransferase
VQRRNTVRTTAGYIWTDYTTNTEIAKELNITQILYKVQECNRNRLQCVNSMHHERLLRILKKTTYHKAEETRRNHETYFWMCETGTGRQVA